MIAVLLAAVTATASPALPPPTTAYVLASYAAALAGHPTPKLLSFEYNLEQNGARTLDQTHRVFRSGNDERDELLTVDGRRLSPPSVHIFHGRRYRYALESLAPRPAAYAFRFVGVRTEGGRESYVLATQPKAGHQAFAVTSVTLDAMTFLPTQIAFRTTAHQGNGVFTFGRVGTKWLITSALAHATVERIASTERIAFQRYRFPASLPPSTFSPPRPLLSPEPAATATALP